MKTYLAAEEVNGKLQINTIRIFDNENDGMKYAKEIGVSDKDWYHNGKSVEKISWIGCRLYEVYLDKKPRLIKVEEIK